jgi:hypothetical protein
MPRTKPLTISEANAIILASKLQAQPVPIVEELRNKTPHGNKGRPATPKQLEGLRKGMEAMKAKREALKLKKEEALRKVAAGEPLSDDEPEAPKPPPEPKTPVIYVRNPRADKGVKKTKMVDKDDFDQFKSSVMETLQKSSAPAVERVVETPVEKIVEKIVDREVVREKIVSGSEMLDRLFFNK